MFQIFRHDFTFTKRQLGIMLCLIGGLAFVGLLSLDVIFSGRDGGIGPAQRLALIGSAGLFLLGLTLLPLRNTPA
jgi:hypothetical protein